MTRDGTAAAPTIAPPSVWEGIEPGTALKVLEDDIRALIRDKAIAEGRAEELTRYWDSKQEKDLLALIGLSDTLSRVLAENQTAGQGSEEARRLLKSMSLIAKMLGKFLDKQGVTSLPAGDDHFNPSWHNAVAISDDSGLPDGTIVKEVLPGYLFKGRILRRADVVVSSGKGSV
jgi:molecular chaperone GrpE (heat shock protein)